MLKSWLFIQTWSLLDSAFYNKLHRWADGQNRETIPRGSCLTAAPYLKLALLFLLGGRKAKYKHCFYQEVHTREKINKITMYQWKLQPRLWRSSPAAHVPCGFALTSCRLMYWQSRALGELGRAGADPAVTCRVFPLRPSRSVWFISSATQSDTSQAQELTRRLLTPDSTAAVSPLSQSIPIPWIMQ